MTTKDLAHVRFTVDAVIAAKGEDHEMLAQRMNSAFGHAIGNGAITGETAAETAALDAKTVLLTPEAASLNEDTVREWITDQIADGVMDLEDVAKLMARYALADPADAREELAERMGMFESCGEAAEARQVGA